MNFGTKALQVLRTVAPGIALAVGGPFGPIAAAALHAALGSTDQSSAEAALLSATPDQLLALKQADQTFTVKMKELGIDEQKLIYDDVANARAREISVKDLTPRILAYVVITLVFLAEGSLLIFGQPKSMDGVVLGRIMGTLDAALMLVLSYYFGSSIGSHDKDDAINKIATTK